MEDHFLFLKKVSFFNSLEDQDIKKIEAVCQKQTFEPGEIIFTEGSLGDRD